MKKQLVMLAVMSALSAQVFAASPDTVLEKAEALETSIYGKVQVGALIDRVNQMDDTVYGAQKSGSLTNKVDQLYASVEGGRGISLYEELNTLEWAYQDRISEGPILERVARLERSVTGRESTGSLQSRIAKLKQSVYGSNVKLTSATGTIEPNTVFKIELTSPINTQKNAVGDPVSFVVAEDVMDGNVLLIPEGAAGTGYISTVKKARSFGRNAQLDIVFDKVPTMSGETFTAIQGNEAKERTKSEVKAAGASVAGAVLLGPVGLVGGFFVKGKSLDLPVGSSIYVQPETTVTTTGIDIGAFTTGDVTERPSSTASTATRDTSAATSASDKSSTSSSSDTSDEHVDTHDDTDVDHPEVTTEDTGDSAIDAPSAPIVVVKRTE